MYTVYILFSEKINKYYIGQTKDLENRLKEHNNGETNFMRGGKPWILVWSIIVASRVEAVQLEKKIKSRGAKRYLEELAR